MKIIPALALTIAVIGGIATWLFLGPIAFLGLQIWAAFIAWASFFSAGGTNEALTKSIAGNIWGVLWGTIMLILVGWFGAGGAPVVGLIVFVTAVPLVLGAHIPVLDVIPAHFYGYASTAGFAILKGSAGLDFAIGTGPFTTIAVSMIIGNLLGIASGKIGNAIATK